MLKIDGVPNMKIIALQIYLDDNVKINGLNVRLGRYVSAGTLTGLVTDQKSEYCGEVVEFDFQLMTPKGTKEAILKMIEGGDPRLTALKKSHYRR